MIGWLRGHLRAVAPGRVLLDVGGVGYTVRTSLSTWYELERLGNGAAAELRIHTHVREDALQLYGFLTDLERQLFERLIGISGIGPKLAIAVLSGIEPRDLLLSVQRGDVARLTSIPGVGKKTSERIVLELKDRLAQIPGSAPPDTAPANGADRVRADLLSALQNLGYHRPQAEKAIDASLHTMPNPTFEQALKAALRELMR